jgi:hypothetical protein
VGGKEGAVHEEEEAHAGEESVALGGVEVGLEGVHVIMTAVLVGVAVVGLEPSSGQVCLP